MKNHRITAGIALLSITCVMFFASRVHAQSRFDTTRQTYTTSLETLSETRKDIRKKRKDDEVLKTHLLNTTKVFRARLDNLEVWTEENASLLVLDKEVILAEIEAQKEELRRIESALMEASGPVLLTHKESLSVFLAHHRDNFRQYTMRLMLSRLDHSVSELEVFAERIAKEYPQAKDDANFVDFTTTLKTISSDIRATRSLLNETTAEDTSKQDIRETIQEQQTLLKKTYSLLRNILFSL